MVQHLGPVAVGPGRGTFEDIVFFGPPVPVGGISVPLALTVRFGEGVPVGPEIVILELIVVLGNGPTEDVLMGLISTPLWLEGGEVELQQPELVNQTELVIVAVAR